MPYAAPDLERVSGAPLHLAGQWPDRQMSVEVLENLEARTLRVVPEQSVEVFEPRSNSRWRAAHPTGRLRPARRSKRMRVAGVAGFA